MPAEIVQFDRSESVVEVGARLFSVIAYPSRNDGGRREEFATALCRWFVLTQAERDYQFAMSPIPLKPIWFIPSDRATTSALERGRKHLQRRVVLAHRLAMPFLKFDSTKHVENVRGLAPSVNNLLSLANSDLGNRKMADLSVIKRTHWAESKPVLHAAAAYVAVAWLAQLVEIDEARKHGATVQTLASIGDGIPLELLLGSVLLTRAIIEVSEPFRQIILRLRKFEIYESDTVQFAFG